MKKNVIIIALIAILILLMIIFIAIQSRSNPSADPDSRAVPTGLTISGAINQNESLQILNFESDTLNNTITPDSIIHITYNRPVTSSEVRFTIDPPIEYTQSIEGADVYILPSTPWVLNTTYTFTFSTLNRNFEMTTRQDQINTAQNTNTRPEGAYDESMAFHLENYPDTYLSNQTPFATERFSIISRFEPEPVGHFAFTVTLATDDADTRSYFRIWLESLGLRADQIDGLDITYEIQP